MVTQSITGAHDHHFQQDNRGVPYFPLCRGQVWNLLRQGLAGPWFHVAEGILTDQIFDVRLRDNLPVSGPPRPSRIDLQILVANEPGCLYR